MEAFIVSAIFLLILLGTAYYWRKQHADRATTKLSPATSHTTFTAEAAPRGLFDNAETRAALAVAEAERAVAETRAALLARAKDGDVEVLVEAQAFQPAPGDGVALYQQALDELVSLSRADDVALQRLIQHITQAGNWRANVALAEVVLARWQRAPERYALGELLHIAALSDDAAVFQQTVEAALAAWRAGRLGWATAHNLHALIESEYWILAPAARQSGAGFVLKRMLVAVRRELAAAAPAASSS